LKKSKPGTYFLIGGLSVVLLSVVATLIFATHTRSGALCVMILKALDIMDACIIAFVAVVAGATTAVFSLSRLASVSAEEERQKNVDENKNDEN